MKQEQNYPTAVTRQSNEDPDAVTLAIAWLNEQWRATGGTLLVYAPDKPSLEEDARIVQFIKLQHVVAATWKTLGNSEWRGGPVLAAWPESDKLGVVMDRKGVTALCVVPWLVDEVAAWVAAYNPARLGFSADQAAEASVLHLDPVVEQGLGTLDRTVNHYNNLAGGSDRVRAVAVVRTLHDAGYTLDPEAVHAWALTNHWSSRAAERLKKLVAEVADGKKPRMSGLFPFRPDILDEWQRQAALRRAD